MAEKELPRVKANRDFSSAHTGSRSKGESFSYDVDKDPAELVKLGYIEVPDAAPAGTAATGNAAKDSK